MRYLGSVAMDNSPRESTCRAEKEPIMANQVGHVGSVALLIFPAESTGHTETRQLRAKSQHTEPFCATLLGYFRGGISPLWQNGDQREGEIAARRCYRRPAGVGVTSREKKPIMANQSGTEPRWQRRLGFLTAGVHCPCAKLPNFRTQCRLGRVFSDLFSVAFFHSDGTETERSKEVGRRCCFETVGSVVALPESTPSGLGKTNIGEDIARMGGIGTGFGEGIAAALQLRFPSRTYPRRRAKSDGREPIKRSRHGHLRGHEPERAKNLHDALSWQRRHG